MCLKNREHDLCTSHDCACAYTEEGEELYAAGTILVCSMAQCYYDTTSTIVQCTMLVLCYNDCYNATTTLLILLCNIRC